MNDIMKIFQALEDFDILRKGVTKAIKNETKEQKGGFLRMLFGTLGASLLGILLAGKGIVRALVLEIKREKDCKSWFWLSFVLCFAKTIGFLMAPDPLTNFEIQKYYQNQPRLNDVFSRNNLTKKIKDGAYVINLDEHADVGTHWIALFCNKNEIAYFDSFGLEHVSEEVK